MAQSYEAVEHLKGIQINLLDSMERKIQDRDTYGSEVQI
jgi:hypothetical protein